MLIASRVLTPLAVSIDVVQLSPMAWTPHFGKHTRNSAVLRIVCQLTAPAAMWILVTWTSWPRLGHSWMTLIGSKKISLDLGFILTSFSTAIKLASLNMVRMGSGHFQCLRQTPWCWRSATTMIKCPRISRKSTRAISCIVRPSSQKQRSCSAWTMSVNMQLQSRTQGLWYCISVRARRSMSKASFTTTITWRNSLINSTSHATGRVV
mmetsp:Transcript_45477/g.90041  ORF Transcript_45477/g.90041 Transcript_45477/m.90041 type:complete len:208 (+) Transcript_45477:571-1194(+)